MRYQHGLRHLFGWQRSAARSESVELPCELRPRPAAPEGVRSSGALVLAHIALAFAIAGLSACAEAEGPEPGAAQLTDFATGIDARFGVEAYAATDPVLKLITPADYAQKTVPKGGKTTFDLVFSTEYFTPGKINIYVDGKLDGATAGDNYTTTALAPGLHTLGAVLVDTNGSEYAMASARVAFHLAVIQPCNFGEDCDDGLPCTQQECIGAACKFAMAPVCCGSTFDCAAGELCNEPNTPNAKCSACLKNADCADDSPCTTDTCDLTGLKGICKHVKADPKCCSKSDAECNDGKGCTIDSCNTVTGKCSNIQPPGSCCESAECVSDDVCLVGSCVDFSCRFGKDNFKPDCCSPGTNPTCNDNYYCTLDKCDKPQTGGWTQCTHGKDAGKPNCCDWLTGNTNECNDGNSCTYDYCGKDYLCYHVEVAKCCAKDGDCNDDGVCTDDKCKIPEGEPVGSCENNKIPECCTANYDCADGKFCTVDGCNKKVEDPAGTCFHNATSGCCDVKEDCDDGKECTDDSCVNHKCIFGPDKFKPNCCDGNADCSDGNACTLDSCDTTAKLCKFVDNGDATCCNSPTDCDDGDCKTADFCDATNKCTSKKLSGSCVDKSECDDGNSCTIDACTVVDGCGTCTYSPNPECCKYDTACDDQKPCTLDRCVNSKCENTPLSQCCIDDKDALTACNDNNACTIEYCVNNQCRHTAPKGGCCTQNADCDDSVACTADSCTNIQSGAGVCANVPASGCEVCTTTNQAVTCDDSNKCTSDTCVSNKCVHSPKSGCCIDKFDCNDGKPCTIDYCITSMAYCVNTEEVGGVKPCCTPETEATECASLDSPCATGKCLDQPDGSKQCVAVAKPACSYELNYCQDFSSASTLALLGWNPADVAGSAKTNWTIATSGGLGPDQYARFFWTPTKLNYDSCLTSPVFQAAGSKAVSIQFDREYVKASGLANIRVLGSLDGENADWTKAVLVDQISPSANLGPETIDLTLPAELAGSNGLRLAVCVSGASTAELNRFGVDNFCIAKGGPPVFTSCPANRTMLAGQSLTVPVKAKDPDLNQYVSFSLVKAPSFATISSALYSWLDSGWNSQVTMKPQLADVGDHEIVIKVTDGHLYKLCTYTVTVTFEGGVLVWKPSEVPADIGTPVVEAIKALNKQAQMVDDLALYSDLTKFDAVFVLLGVYPNNHTLKESEINSLKLFLSQGGRVYMEGGDTWAFDSPTSLHAFFKVEGILDSAPTGVTGPLKGYSIFTDANQNPVKHLQWAYSQSADFNNVNDQIAAKNVAKTANLLRNEGFDKFWVQVAHDDPNAKYRTLASSVLFAGIKADTDSANELIKQIFKFFDTGLPACTNSTSCNDGNSCTTDVCSDGVCSYNNTCLCNAQSALKCGDVKTKLVSNGSGATDVVNGYPCASGLPYLGKEMAYSFTNAQSAPVTIKLTNVSSAKVRLMVLKATSKGCDPDGCLASEPVASGGSSLSFPAQAGVTYYVIVDGEGDSDAATFDLEVICSAGEICDDAKDNNGNGLADCDDWASCCGFPACGELCDGLDNDCDGDVDENCDDDGDNYCDLSMGIKKTAQCKKSALPTDSSTINGDDCADGDTAVNPGAPEICGNGKDDNCNGQQDEIGASGCTNFFADLDGDSYGSGTAKCLCQSEGAYKAKLGGDCNDAEKTINPGAGEDCSTVADDDCDDSNNDLNALGCVNFYLDKDSDTYGDSNSPFKCQCVGADGYVADKAGDCDDLDQSLNPGKTEICNGKDDNCNQVVDEGCDDDKDGYCDVNLPYDSDAGVLQVCPKGGGDSDDKDKGINPEGKEICDGKDNDSNGQVDENCDKDKDGYCDSAMIVVGTPTVCTKGGGDCDDAKLAINPGAVEDCATSVDDNCNGNNNDIGAKGCSPFFYDGDDDKFGINSNQCLCVANGAFKAKNPGDCADADNTIHPDAVEICDNKDNDCDKQVDDGCDDDGDGYCDKAIKFVGAPSICASGAGDCDDGNANVNPAQAEVCGNNVDENCNGNLNEENALNCVNFYHDDDKDDYGAGNAKCFCTPTSIYTTSKTNDCEDFDPDVNPGKEEICDGKDNDCSGKADDDCDLDLDGYCAAGKTVVNGASCTKGTDDCNDQDPNVYKGKAKETCDGQDDDCNGKIDNGCDDDKDGYCDYDHFVADPAPTLCSLGTGDCDDFNFDVNPAAPEVCGNSIDDNCNNSQNDENAAGCLDFFFDADVDGYGLSLKKCLCSKVGFYSAPKDGDCNDGNVYVKPGEQESCDNLDNDCDGDIDEAGATGCSNFFYDGDKDNYGIDLASCVCTPSNGYTALQKGDCNDTVKTISPGLPELCNDADDNCDGQVDEGCNADGDDYCAASKTTVGFPTVCTKGGGDCNDADSTINTAGVEICNGADDNCDKTIDEGCDDDGDKFCDSNMKTVGTPNACPNGGNDCDDTNKDINPAVSEICGNTVDENCSGTFNDVDATGCTKFYEDKDGDAYGKNGGESACLCIKTGTLTATKAGDCDDSNDLINSDATELCDDVDNSCNTQIDEGCDVDGDSYCDTAKTTIGTPAVCPLGGGDCNDQMLTINPGAKEVCGNTVDENCDGSLNGDNSTGCKDYFYDGDGDGFGVNVKQCLCTPENGFTATAGGDCDDTVKTINPSAKEVCGNGKDDNCNGNNNDPDAQGCSDFFKDADKDGYGTGTASCLCTAEGEFITAQGGDCNDSDNTIKPGTAEICDAKDNNCNGSTDEDCDKDNDGHCDAGKQITEAALCKKSTPKCAGIVSNGVCYQAFNTQLAWTPGQAACKELGGNLAAASTPEENTVIRNAANKGCGTNAVAWIGLNDHDKEGTWAWTTGVGVTHTNWAAGQPVNSITFNAVRMNTDATWQTANPADAFCYVCRLGKVSVGSGDDCVDNDPKINPSATEECDDKDNNCDGVKDDGCDNDKDGYCAKSKTIVGSPVVCNKGTQDCDDSNNTVNPGKAEFCDDADNDCDNATDEGCDDDNDEFCDSTLAIVGAPQTCQKGGNDCNDTVFLVNPAAPEACGDGVDNNCVGGIDEVCNDQDGDGYCKGIQSVSAGCPKGGGDCNDGDKFVNPGSAEDCKTVGDDNCNGLTNEKDAKSCTDFYLDEDQDGYGAKEQGTSDNLAACSSCGTGVDGDYVASSNVNLAAGTYNYKSFTVNAGVTVTVTGSVPLVLKVKGKVTINGTIELSGQPGQDISGCCFNSAGGTPGAGGGAGGGNVYGSQGAPGDGTGGGQGGCASGYGSGGGGGGYAFSGNSGTTTAWSCGTPGAGGSSYGNQQLTTLTGGSGGGSGGYGSAANSAGSGGGGGGGAFRLDALEVVVGAGGQVLANGGRGGNIGGDRDGGAGGGGSGGTVWLRADKVTISGKVEAKGGAAGVTDKVNGHGGDGGSGSDGRIRIDANALVGSSAPTAFKGDGAGQVVKICQCAQSEGASAKITGDCDDGNAQVNPGAIEICDGIDNTCAGTVDSGCDADLDGFCASGKQIFDSKACPKTGTVLGAGCTATAPTLLGQFNMETYSHGGGYHRFRKEFWYPQWAGQTVYRYNDAMQYQGNFNCGQHEIMALEGDSAEDAWYSANWGYYTISRRNGLNTGAVWNTSVGYYAGGVAVAGNEIYAIRHQNQPIYVLNKANGQQIKTFNLNQWFGGSMYGGLFVHKGFLWVPNDSNRNFYKYDLSGVYQNESFQVAPNIYNAAYDGSRVCVSANSSTVHCYDLGKFKCSVGDDCNDDNKNVNPEGTEACNDLDDNCNAAIDEGCDDDKDGFCDAQSAFPFGNCCAKHADAGCSVPSIAACVCAQPGYDTCCTVKWTEDCGKAAKGFACASCKFPSKCPGGGGDCDDQSNLINPKGKESCATPEDDDCDGTLNTINADGCAKYYVDVDQDAYGGVGFQCMCQPEATYTALVSGDCDDNDATVSSGAAQEICDGKDNNCNSGTDELCDADGDGYCSNGKIVIKNTACPNSPESAAGCGSALASTAQFQPRTLGVNPRSYGGGWHPKLSQWWFPEYAGSNTMVYRFEKDMPNKPVGSFNSGLPEIRQIHGDDSTDDWYAATYQGSSQGLYRMKGATSEKVWTSDSLTSYLSGVATSGGIVYTMRYNDNKVWAVNMSDGKRRADKEFNLNTYTGSTFGLAIIDGKFFRTSDSRWIWRYDMGTGVHDGTQIQPVRTPYAVAYNATEICSSDGSQIVQCMVMPKANESFGSKQTWANPRSHGAGYHFFHKEYWFPQWASPTIYRYNQKLHYVGEFNSGQSELMQIWGDGAEDAWYSANWGHNTITRRNKFDSTPAWSFNIGSTAGGVAVGGNSVYAMRASGSTVWELNKANGQQIRTFDLNGWFAGGTNHGGLVVEGDKIWRAADNRWFERHLISNGSWDGTRIYLDTNPYSTTWDGNRFCFSPNNQYQYCIGLPNDTSRFDINSPSAGGSGGGTVIRTFNMAIENYGVAWNPKDKEFWSPRWSDGQVTRMDANGSVIGTFSIPSNQNMDLWIDQDASFATANWGENTCKRFNAAKQHMWSYNIGSTAGGVVGDEDYIYCMRYHQNTVWVQDKATGNHQYSFGLENGTTNIYGGMEIVGDAIVVGTDNQYIRMFDRRTGRQRGVSFRPALGVYSSFWNGKELCVGSNNYGSQTFYCYDVRDTKGRALTTRADIRNAGNSHGAGYHPFYKEYWYPEWSGEWVYRYDETKSYVASFWNGRGNIMHLAGDPDSRKWYAAEWGHSTIGAFDGERRGTIWTYNLGTTAGSVAVAGNFVYGMRASSGPLYKINKGDGTLHSTINVNGGNYLGHTTYGPLAVIGDTLYRGDNNGYVERFNLNTGNFIGQFAYFGWSAHTGTFDPVTRELCAHHNSYPGESRCIFLPSGSGTGAGDTRDLGVDARSHGGGYHGKFKEYWYPEWNGNDSTIVYRHDENGIPVGTFNSGLRYISQIIGDDSHSDWFASIYDGSSTYARVHRMQSQSATKVWTSPYVTTYLGGVAADSNFVYTHRTNSDARIYVFDRATGNRRTDKEFDLKNMNGNTTWGIAVVGSKLYRTSSDNWIYRHDMSDGDHDGVKIPTATSAGSLAYNGKELCIANTSSGGLVYCYELESSTTSYKAKQVSQATWGEGGGFHVYRNEYWYPAWSSGDSVMYRYNKQRVPVGQFTAKQRYMRQVWGDSATDVWYSANWSDGSITRRRGLGSDLDWTYNMGGNPGGVTGDDTAVYAMRYDSPTVHVLNKKTGAALKTFDLIGAFQTSLYGGLAVAKGKLFYGNTNAWVYRYDLNTGVHDNVRFTMPTGIYASTFDGEDYCVSDSNMNNNNAYCVPLMSTTCTKGNDCDDGFSKVNPGVTEFCDDGDNNCNNTIDEGCDDDNDDYCDSGLITLGTPQTCTKGGGDCNDAGATENPGSAEICDSKDNNCNKLVDEAGASGCTTFYYDGDQDGSGVFSGSKCLCAADGVFSSPTFGDCDDSCPECAPGKPELCDGKNNTCATNAMTGSTYTRQVNLGANATYHGAGYHSKRNEYWWTNWASSTIWRYNTNGGFLGQFDSGQTEMMGLAGDTANDDFYSANWGHGTVTRRKFEQAVTVWARNIGAYPSGIDYGNGRVYVMKDYNDIQRVWVLDASNGQDVAGVPHFDLKGEGFFSAAGDQLIYGGLRVIGDRIYRTSRNNWTYRYLLGNGSHDGVKMFSQPQSTYVDNSVSNGSELCVASYGNNNVRCYALPSANANLQPKTVTMETYSHGGGYHHKRQEYWYPQWSGTTMYRYDATRNALGNFSTGQNEMMDVKGDYSEDNYYTANWGYYTITKRAGLTSNLLWSTGLGYYAGGVAVDQQYVYGMRADNTQVWVLNRANGTTVRTFNVATGAQQWDGNWMHGGLFVHGDSIFRSSGGGRWIHSYKLTDGSFSGIRIYTAQPIYNASYDGKEVCISPNNNQNYCYSLTGGTFTIDEGCDKDADGYCDSNKVTVGKPASCPKGAGDCNDGAITVNPLAQEICNGADDNCNGTVDDGANLECTANKNAEAKCENGACKIYKCNTGFYDLNGLGSDGCECNSYDGFEPNDTCDKATQLKALNDQGDAVISVKARLVDPVDSDWFAFHAADTPESGATACDAFNVRVRFLQNPSNALRLEVFRGSCPPAKYLYEAHKPNLVDQGVCCGQTDFNWFTNFKGYSRNVYSSGYSEFGECNCLNQNPSSIFYTGIQGWNYGPAHNPYGTGDGGPYGRFDSSKPDAQGKQVTDRNPASQSWGYDYTRCHNDSANFFVRVYREGVMLQCFDYLLEVTNGTYGAPSTGHVGYGVW